MSLLLRMLMGVVGTLVVASVVTGVVATSSAEDPAPRETIVINDEGRDPVDKRGENAEEQRDEGEDDEDDIQSVRVDPDTLDDFRDDRRDAREDRRDDRQDRIDDLTTTAATTEAAPDTVAAGTTAPVTVAAATTAPHADDSSGTAAAATTDDAPTRRSGWSVRTRIISAVVLLVLLALTGAGALVYVVEYNRLQEQAVARIDQELDEFAALDQEGIDPETGEAFVDVRALLTTFLQRNVPDENEVLVAWFGGRPREAIPGEDSYVTRRGDFEQTVEEMLAEGGTRHVEVPSYGEAMLTVQSVQAGNDAGALVIVTYLERDRAELRSTMQTYALVALLSLAGITAVAAWQSGRLLAPLRTLRETAEEITETDLSRRIPESGNDDITALTHTLNGMLARLEEAFVGQRHFLDDAGHELRTPLTVLRGHLELMDHDDPDEVAETRALLLDEVDRMSRLVGDLILLAKHDRPDFLTPAPVSVERLTHTLHAKARALAERDWRLDEVGEGIASLDEQRVTQALLQLADNAVKHTVDGDRISIGSAVADGTVRLWVADSGPGVPDELKEHVFERFGRAGVRPDDEGFGLGLSIVRAIAAAHGGRVTVADHHPWTGPDGPRPGAVFTLHLPQEHPWPAS